MVDVFEQVEEELRSARYKRLAKVGLPILAGVLIVALVAALGWWGWDSLQTSKANKASAAFDRGMESLREGDTAAANDAFAEAAREGNGAYRALALMEQAGIAVTADKTAEAVELFDKAAKAAGEPIIGDTAALKAAFLVMDTGSLADIEKRLEPLTSDKRPYNAFAREALALARLQHGKATEAREELVQLQLGQNVPDAIRQRAQAAIEVIDAGGAANLAAIVEAQKALPAATPAATQAPAATAQAAPAAQ